MANNSLLIFLIVIAVLLIIMLVIAGVAIRLRNRSGRTLSKSTYGNNIEEGRETGPTRPTGSTFEGERSGSGVSGNSVDSLSKPPR